MKLQFTVYRQASRVRNGYTVYRGEDACPYIGDNCLFVADGLGGAAAIRHTKFKKELAEKDKLIETLFGGVFKLPLAEGLENYIQLSFTEFLDIVGRYSDNVLNMKKSGYFGSRIVTALFLYEILGYGEFPSVRAIFNGYNELKSNRKKREFLEETGNALKNTIQANLQKVAANANLIYESGISGMALLGTTLCATLYNETDDYVDAIYLVAGDSRPYMWDEGGLYQVAEDQEGADGGMTNYIKANPDADFYIDCKYHRFKKPCILFNASDGCFDSKYFHSQMAFEKLILDTIVSQPDMDAVGRSLTETFGEYGTHDDSSTIAAVAFGYDSYDALKEAAAKRLAVIQKEYLDKVPGLLEKDYGELIEENKKSALEDSKKIIVNLKRELAVNEYCMKYVVNTDSWKTKSYRLSERMAKEIANIEHIKEDICQIIKDNFVRFASHYCTFFMGLLSGGPKTYNYSDKLLYHPDEYKNVNREIAEDRKDIFSYVKDRVLSFDYDSSEMEKIIPFGDQLARFNSLTEKLKACDGNVEAMYMLETMKIISEEFSAYVDKNYLDIAKAIVNNTIVASKETRKEACQIFFALDGSQEDKKLEEMQKIQQQLLAEYDGHYLSLLNVPEQEDDGEEEEEEEEELPLVFGKEDEDTHIPAVTEETPASVTEEPAKEVPVTKNDTTGAISVTEEVTTKTEPETKEPETKEPEVKEPEVKTEEVLAPDDDSVAVHAAKEVKAEDAPLAPDDDGFAACEGNGGDADTQDKKEE